MHFVALGLARHTQKIETCERRCCSVGQQTIVTVRAKIGQKNVLCAVDAKKRARQKTSDKEQKMSSDKQSMASLKQKQEKKIADALAPEPMKEDIPPVAAAAASAAKAEPAKTETKSDSKANDDKKTSSSGGSSSSSASTAATKRETRDIGEFYSWKTADDVLKHFDVRFAQADFDALKERVQKSAKQCDVTLVDVLRMKANVMNQREADKLAHIAQKQKELRDAAEAALGTLLARAQVDKKQREARELKRKLQAERKQNSAK